MSAMIPIHPQTCPGQPDRLRWIVPAGLLPFTGTAATVSQPLATLLDDGTLAEIHVEPAAVVTVLGAAGDWSREGARVRSALHAALEDPAGWAAAGEHTTDDGLLAAAREVIDGPVGALARSHGGSLELVGAQEGIVTVRMAGACRGCPAAQVTLRTQLEARLRRHRPDLRAVVAADR